MKSVESWDTSTSSFNSFSHLLKHVLSKAVGRKGLTLSINAVPHASTPQPAVRNSPNQSAQSAGSDGASRTRAQASFLERGIQHNLAAETKHGQTTRCSLSQRADASAVEPSLQTSSLAEFQVLHDSEHQTVGPGSSSAVGDSLDDAVHKERELASRDPPPPCHTHNTHVSLPSHDPAPVLSNTASRRRTAHANSASLTAFEH
eukprot:1883335-Rhodomonas_salina.1